MVIAQGARTHDRSTNQNVQTIGHHLPILICGQRNREKFFLLVPFVPAVAWSRETGLAVPSRASPLLVSYRGGSNCRLYFFVSGSNLPPPPHGMLYNTVYIIHYIYTITHIVALLHVCVVLPPLLQAVQTVLWVTDWAFAPREASPPPRGESSLPRVQ